MGKNPIGGILNRFAKWLVKEGKEELEKEIEERRDAGPGPDGRWPEDTHRPRPR